MLSSSRHARVWVLLFLGSILGILACSSNDPSEPPPPTGPTVDDVVESTGWFPPVSPDSNAWALARFDSTGDGGEPLVCTDFDGVQTGELAELTTLAFANSLHYPGAVLQWASLAGTTPQAVLADRSAGSVTLTAAAGGEVEGEVAATRPAEVEAWRIDALDQLGPVEPGLWDLSAGIVYNADHLSVIAGVGPEGMTAEASQRLALRGDPPPGRVLLRLQRNHHSVVCPYPGNATAAFAPHVAGKDIENQMAEGNPPVWVAAQDYGQLLLVLVEADADPDIVLLAAVNSFAAAAENRSPDGGPPLVHDLPGVTMSVFAMGADADAAEIACAAGQQPLADFLQADPGPADELPGLTATLEALRNGGPLTRGVTAEFAFAGCEIYEPVFDDVLWAFSAADARTSQVEGDMTSDGQGRYRYDGGTRIYTERLIDYIPDLVGQGGATRINGRRPFFLADAINGRPAMEVYELALPDGVLYSEVQFDGSELTGRDYTIFIVCGMPSGVRVTYATQGGDQHISQWNRTNFFLHGTGTGVRHNMWVGYPDRQLMTYEHTGYPLEFPHRPTEGWHVYAVRFGIGNGMTIYFDGELLDGAHNGSLTYPLLEFSGATICSRWRGIEPAALAVFWMSEIVAYAGAGTDQMVVDESARLMEKYGITP